MEFIPRGRDNSVHNQQLPGAPLPTVQQHRKSRLSLGVKFMRVEVFTILVGIALLLVALALYAGLSKPGAESNQINVKQYQAVFLSNGQVYFGKITDLNNKYLVLEQVFYIENNSPPTNNQTQQNSNYALRKLGSSELHLPEDKMVINRDTVTFWENLKDSGQVVTKIGEYYKNPAGSSSSDSTNTETGQSAPGDTSR